MVFISFYFRFDLFICKIIFMNRIFFSGAIIFFIGFILNLQADSILRNLRKDNNERDYKIPRGKKFLEEKNFILFVIIVKVVFLSMSLGRIFLLNRLNGQVMQFVLGHYQQLDIRFLLGLILLLAVPFIIISM